MKQSHDFLSFTYQTNALVNLLHPFHQKKNVGINLKHEILQ